MQCKSLHVTKKSEKQSAIFTIILLCVKISLQNVQYMVLRPDKGLNPFFPLPSYAIILLGTPPKISLSAALLPSAFSLSICRRSMSINQSAQAPWPKQLHRDSALLSLSLLPSNSHRYSPLSAPPPSHPPHTHTPRTPQTLVTLGNDFNLASSYFGRDGRSISCSSELTLVWREHRFFFFFSQNASKAMRGRQIERRCPAVMLSHAVVWGPSITAKSMQITNWVMNLL